ncbi:hypothetical protein V1514DRAFT_76981 [Lipomyces japonicus]|uniref:uncharacterized protein n=1 Tax=Lipomyces japonicus TaxID=56871 RepID=UPI0034CFEE46
MDPLIEIADSGAPRAAATSPVFYFDTDDAEYFAFHDLNLDSSHEGRQNQHNSLSAFPDLHTDVMTDVPLPLRPALISTNSEGESPTSSHATPVLTHDEDDADDDDDHDKYMAEHFDFESATSSQLPLTTTSDQSSGFNTGAKIVIRTSGSESSLSSVKAGQFSYPPSPKSFSSQHSTSFTTKPQLMQHQQSTKDVRDITPPQQTPSPVPTNAEDETYLRPADWAPPAIMEDFDPLAWLNDDTPYQLTVSTDTFKSRVETQIKAQLTFKPSPKEHYIHLPATTIAKPRQQLRKAFNPDGNTLEVDAIVVCDHNRYKYINVCTGCVKRERKRANRKKVPSSDDTNWLDSQENRTIMFNCAELLDIHNNGVSKSSGTTCQTAIQDNVEVKIIDIPMRIPCYCRHHSEKVGFRVYFVVKDHSGKVMARAFTEPIMITDDHKTSNALARRKTATGVTSLSNTQPSSSANASDNSASNSPPRNEYGFIESANPRKRKMSPKYGRTQSANMISMMQRQPIQQNQLIAKKNFVRGADENFNTRSHLVESFGFPAYSSANSTALQKQQPVSAISPVSHHASPVSSVASPESAAPRPYLSHAIVGTAPQVTSPAQSPRESLGSPGLQRLIPTEGPIRGGIEVTILGTNFNQGLTVMFGDQPAIKTHIWSESTIVAILPPAVTAGPVVVRLRSISEISNDNLKLFTYVDDTDRQLMELALQVVGLKMTGRLEDARQIAMRIVSQTGGNDSKGGKDTMMAATTASMGHGDLERTLLHCIDLVDYNDSPYKVQWQLKNKSGQTMMHLATLLGLQRLVAALLARGASYKVKDVSGYTPLHLAAIHGDRVIVQRLLNSGADVLVRTVHGKTVLDLAKSDEIKSLLADHVDEPSKSSVTERSIQTIDHKLSCDHDFPDWPTSSGPSSPARSTSDDFEYSDLLDYSEEQLDDETNSDDEALTIERLRTTEITSSNNTEIKDRKSKSSNRKKLADNKTRDRNEKDVVEETNHQKHLTTQQRVAEYLNSWREQAFNKMHLQFDAPTWDAATHFSENIKDNMFDALTAFSSFKPTLANFANTLPAQSKRANELVQATIENSWLADYFTTSTSAESRHAPPPSYDEIYPDGASAAAVAVASSSNVKTYTEHQESEQEVLLKFWQNKKKKQMRNDLMLFAFWVCI